MSPKQIFHQFLDQHTGVISKVCRIYADDADEFQDYFQEVVLQLWRSYASFRGDAKSSTWVYRVALNVCLSQLKLKKRRPDRSPLEIAPLHHLAHQKYDSTQDEQLRKMYAAIRQLKEVDRAIILLYLEKKSYEEIAEIMGVSVSNVGVRISRSKQHLNKIIHGRTSSILG